mmetsp:Transcript_22163/g.48037  ORF Transcript_22163/g.48037 Transcript_22163/m.48037 type:complete len:209 (+) Transcript_22163:1655-2281(+)
MLWIRHSWLGGATGIILFIGRLFATTSVSQQEQQKNRRTECPRQDNGRERIGRTSRSGGVRVVAVTIARGLVSGRIDRFSINVVVVVIIIVGVSNIILHRSQRGAGGGWWSGRWRRISWHQCCWYYYCTAGRPRWVVGGRFTSGGRLLGRFAADRREKGRRMGCIRNNAQVVPLRRSRRGGTRGGQGGPNCSPSNNKSKRIEMRILLL